MGNTSEAKPTEHTYEHLKTANIPEPPVAEQVARLINITMRQLAEFERAREIDVGCGIHLKVRPGEAQVRAEAIDTNIHTHTLLGEIAYWIVQAAEELDPDRPFRDTREPVN